jgi:hypothetical protein
VSKVGKALDRFYNIPKDFTWDELVQVLNSKGYYEIAKGKTGGSRRKFSNALNQIISLHKPHPAEIVKEYALKQIIENLDAQKKVAEAPLVKADAESKPPKKLKKNNKK